MYRASDQFNFHLIITGTSKADCVLPIVAIVSRKVSPRMARQVSMLSLLSILVSGRSSTAVTRYGFRSGYLWFINWSNKVISAIRFTTWCASTIIYSCLWFSTAQMHWIELTMMQLNFGGISTCWDVENKPCGTTGHAEIIAVLWWYVFL